MVDVLWEIATSRNRLAPRHGMGIIDDILFSWMETCDEFDNPFALGRGIGDEIVLQVVEELKLLS